MVDLRAYPEATTLDATRASANTSGSLTLVGNSLNNYIVGSSENANIVWGFAGNNTMTFNSEQANQIYYSGTSNDFVTDFAAGSEGDAVIVNTNFVSAVRNGAAVAFISETGNSLLLYTDSTDGTISYSVDSNEFKSAQIAEQGVDAMIYSSDSEYFALGQQGALVITGEDNNDVRLDGSTGQGFYNVLNLDASTSTGDNSLGGDANANVLIGGSGTNVLWGGNDTADDVLIGGNNNTFYLGKGNGDKCARSCAKGKIFLKDRKPTLYREEALYEMDRGGSDRPLVLGGRSA